MRVSMRDVAAWIHKEKLSDDVRLLLQVHDELVFEIKEDKVDDAIPQIVNIMEAALAGKETHGVPLIADVKIGPNWHDMESYTI